MAVDPWVVVRVVAVRQQPATVVDQVAATPVELTPVMVVVQVAAARPVAAQL
jgi:hypothetical protein